MSLVGPRPETPEYIGLLTAQERRILEVRPGMAGPSTLAYSREEPAILARQADPDGYYRSHLLHQRVAADLAYVERSSLLTDVWILARTALFVVDGLAGAVFGHSSGDEAVRLSD
jgi:lipopolysaccharide/colanic/teichoic acid biosynthesis glycosyltransferase